MPVSHVNFAKIYSQSAMENFLSLVLSDGEPLFPRDSKSSIPGSEVPLRSWHLAQRLGQLHAGPNSAETNSVLWKPIPRFSGVMYDFSEFCLIKTLFLYYKLL